MSYRYGRSIGEQASGLDFQEAKQMLSQMGQYVKPWLDQPERESKD